MNTYLKVITWKIRWFEWIIHPLFWPYGSPLISYSITVWFASNIIRPMHDTCQTYWTWCLEDTANIDLDSISFMCKIKIPQNKRVSLFLVLHIYKYIFVFYYILGITIFKIFIWGGISLDIWWIYGWKFSFTGTCEQSLYGISNLIYNDIPPQMKILNMVIYEGWSESSRKIVAISTSFDQ